MTYIDRLRSHGLFDTRVPRYTSYPPAPHFSTEIGGEFQASCLRALPAATPVSVYLHVPFCWRLCWFCACHTQGTRTLGPVEAYIDMVEAELDIVSRSISSGIAMKHLHWGGGTPTILSPELIARTTSAIRRAFQKSEGFEFSVEIDPTVIDRAKIAALREAGMSRASIGVQDFAIDVQEAIGRIQSLETTQECVSLLRDAGVTSLNMDLVYGLPHQTLASFAETVRQVVDLSPDRVALFGYAHVPHMSKRQKLIDEGTLPGDEERFHLAALARKMFVAAGYAPIGIDHFARQDDALAIAARTGALRRNFQGYTTDDSPTLIGLGASSISRFPQGYVQNAAATPAYMQRIEADRLAGARGHAFVADDLPRARVIEMIMCDFQIDQAALEAEFGDGAERIRPIHRQVASDFGDLVEADDAGLRLRPEGEALARLIAERYDAYNHPAARYSKAS